MIERVLAAVKSLRCPFSLDEYDLHKMTCEALALAGISCAHEAVIGKRCRIDILCGEIGIELKRGKPTKSVLVKQLTRYAETGKLRHLIVLSEQTVAVPGEICGVQSVDQIAVTGLDYDIVYQISFVRIAFCHILFKHKC